MTVIIGYGNELMEDDWIGIYIAQQLEKRNIHNWQILFGGTPGFNILWDILGKDKIIIIDSVLSGNTSGKIYRLSYKELMDNTTYSAYTSHDVNWGEIIGLGLTQYKSLFPKKIVFLLIEINSTNLAYKTFSKAIDNCKKQVLSKIEQEILQISQSWQEICRN